MSALLSRRRLLSRYPPQVLALALMGLLLAAGCGRASVPPSASPKPSPQHARVTEVWGTATVTIEALETATITSVEVIPSHAVLLPGESTVLSAVAYDRQGRPVGRDVTFRWRMLDPGAGYISKGGVLRAGFVSTTFQDAVEVTAVQELAGRVTEVRGVASISVADRLGQAKPMRLQVYPPSLYLRPRQSLELQAFALDADGLVVPSATLTWTLQNPWVGSLTDAGQFTASGQPGSYPEAIRVTTPSPREGAPPIAATVSVEIAEAPVDTEPQTLFLVPQAVSLSPEQPTRFHAILLDGRGNQLRDARLDWRLTEPKAGTISEEGLFRAGQETGTFSNAVEVVATLPDDATGREFTAAATIIVTTAVERAKALFVTVSPQQVQLAPRQRARLTVSAVDGRGVAVRDASITWSAPTGAAQVDKEGRVVAGDIPGIYKEGIKVEVSVQGPEGTMTVTRSVDLLIEGELSRVDVIPGQAVVPPGGTLQFIFEAYDANGLRLPLATGEWSLADSSVGRIDRRGRLVAGQRPGTYQDAIRVRVEQRSAEG
ncbi:MAG: hypothetical protein HYY00_08800 [Chloroflexi bacterium]|nr:hypothetical protein [Chloroflexota bacterium]